MGNFFLDLPFYTLRLLFLTLGMLMICGFAVRLCSRAFSALIGGASETVFDVTAIVGTPVHELGHALMCPLFGHKITGIRLWSPTAKNGVYGYVEHSYNRKNPWARLGNLFIGIGPLLSGLGVVVLTLLLCFPSQWQNYLVTSRELLAEESLSPAGAVSNLLSLLLSIPKAFATDWLRSLIGVTVILSVSLHVSLSWADVKGSLGALPLYLLLLVLFALATQLAGVTASVLSFLSLLNLRVLSVFCLIVAFAAVWVVIALLARMIRIIIKWF